MIESGNISESRPQDTPETPSQFPLLRLNFIIMIIAGVLIVLGFLLMTGSSSTPEEFNPDIFSTRRIVIGPLFAFLGFVLMGIGIIWPSRHADRQLMSESNR